MMSAEDIEHIFGNWLCQIPDLLLPNGGYESQSDKAHPNITRPHSSQKQT